MPHTDCETSFVPVTTSSTESISLALETIADAFRLADVGLLGKAQAEKRTPIEIAQERERNRFHTGHYRSLPDTVWAEFNKLGIRIPWHHFLHMSRLNPGKVAFTPDIESLKRDRQVTTRIGRYLSRYGYGQWAPRISAVLSEFFSEGLQYATTARDIRWVYENGPDSCMGKHHENFYCSDEQGKRIHPCEVYAGSGDIAIAYVCLNGDGGVSARAVVNYRDKLFARVYGSCVLNDMLLKAGYTEDQDALDGCRLSLIRSTQYEGVIAPYLDGESVTASEEDGWLLITSGSSGEYNLQSTSGIAEAARFCPCCEELRSGEFYEVTGGAHDGEEVCLSCIENYYVAALDEYRNRVYLDTDDAIFCGHDGNYYTPDGFDEYVVTDYQGDHIYRQEAVECYFTNEFIIDRDSIRVLLPNGQVVPAIPDEDQFVFSDLLGKHLVVEDLDAGLYPKETS